MKQAVLKMQFLKGGTLLYYIKGQGVGTTKSDIKTKAYAIMIQGTAILVAQG